MPLFKKVEVIHQKCTGFRGEDIRKTGKSSLEIIPLDAESTPISLTFTNGMITAIACPFFGNAPTDKDWLIEDDVDFKKACSKPHKTEDHFTGDSDRFVPCQTIIQHAIKTN